MQQSTSKKNKVLLTGATGYIGQRLLPLLVEKGCFVVCCVRDKARFHPRLSSTENIEVVEVDLENAKSLKAIPTDIDAAYYLVHSMATSKEYKELERRCANNFREAMSQRSVEQVIYLSGMVNEEHLSPHLESRLMVEEILKEGEYALTTLRAGIVIGSGSASFEIIRDLVEKLPVMITPRWLETKCQPIGVADVLSFLVKSLLDERLYNKNYDIGSPDTLTYKEMLKGYAEVRNLKRKIWVVPVMTPKLSSYWLYFVTATSYKLATALVGSMKVNVVARNNDINEILDVNPMSYRESLEKAFSKIQRDEIASSWKDAMSSGVIKMRLQDHIEVPEHGCFKDTRKRNVQNKKKTIQKLWALGGKTGWYYGNWMWRARGWLDKLVGGVGLRRGRTHAHMIEAGDALDFWRVLHADKKNGNLLLFAEMKLPGEAWLEFNIVEGEIWQTATFRPKGLLGRLYWFSVWPFHGLVFSGMINRLASSK